MNLKKTIRKAGLGILFMLSLSNILIIISCKKDSIKNPDVFSNRGASFKNINASVYSVSNPISLTGVSNMTITGVSILAGTGPAISLTNCTNIHITKSKLYNGTTVNGLGINLNNCKNITIDSCNFSSLAAGVHAYKSTGVIVTANQMLNMVGPSPRGQFVQFDNVSGAGNMVSNNRLENIMGASSSQYAIDMYMTNGTAASPVMIKGNWIRGGGPNKSSGGINLGDNGGSYQTVENNILVNTGANGMAVTGGTNIQILTNKIYAAQNTFTNLGIFVWNEYTSISSCSIITVSGNLVNWTNSAGVASNHWNQGNCGTVTGWSNNTWGANINASILPAVIVSMSQTTIISSFNIFSSRISLTGVSNLTIRGDTIIGDSLPCINLANCSNIHITKSKLMNGTGVSAVGINLYNCKNITIDSCFFSSVASGVYASTCSGIVVNHNQMRNMLGPYPRGQFVQFNTVSGAGNRVTNNKCENIMGSSYPEDAINMYMTNGTAASPVMISGNWIRGGGPSTTGGGIALGDNSGSYQTAQNNILVNPGQYGIAVAGGSNMTISNNQIYAAKNTFTNVGIFAWNQYTSISACSIIMVNGNLVNWTNSLGIPNNYWDGGNCGAVATWANNTWGANINASILPATIITYQ
jgi:hypothetical protein